MSTPMHGLDPRDDDALPTVSPFELLKVVWRRKAIVLLVVVLTTLVAVALALRQEKQYSASASLLFRNPGFASALGGSDVFANGADPERDAQTNIDVVSSRAVATVVRRDLRTGESPESLLASIAVTPSSDSDVATVTATRSSPKEAATVANAFADSYIAYRRATDRATVDQARASLRQQQLTADAEDRADLAANIRKLELLQTIQTGNAEVIARATPDDNPTSPHPRRNGILGLIVGVLVGCGLALLLDFLDKRLQSQQDVEAAYPDYPVIGLVPEDKVGSRAVAPTGRTGEAYRVMREGLRFVDPEREVSCILVTSAEEGEGKSTVARQLASALATGDQQVVLIEADMRRPTASAILGIHPATEGLSDLLVSSERPQSFLTLPGGVDSSLAVLSSGTVPPNPADLLRSPRMEQAIERLLSSFDLVIIDAPPLDPVADTRVLLQLPQIDAVLFVARVGTTRRDRAREARRVLAQSGRKVLGLVVIGPSSRTTSGYYDDAPIGASAPLSALGKLVGRR